MICKVWKYRIFLRYKNCYLQIWERHITIKICFSCTSNIIFQDNMTQNSIVCWHFFVFGHSIFFVKKQWIFRMCTFPSLDRDFDHSFKIFRKNWFISISPRFQAFIWYQICQPLNWCVCHFITIAKSASQSSVHLETYYFP